MSVQNSSSARSDALTPTATAPRGELRRLGYTHEAMVDVVVADPRVSIAELAEVFGFSTGWVQRVLASDSFQARVAQRKAQLTDPIISATIVERLRGVTSQAIDIVQEKLSSEESASYALEALGLSLAASSQRKVL